MQEKEGLLNRLVTGVLFSPDRHATKSLLESVIYKSNLEKEDLDVLNSIELAAPSPNDLQTVIPIRNTPICFFSPYLETTQDKETAEHAIAGGLAKAVVMTRGTGRNQVDSETRNLLRAWGYAAPKLAEQRAGARA